MIQSLSVRLSAPVVSSHAVRTPGTRGPSASLASFRQALDARGAARRDLWAGAMHTRPLRREEGR